MATGIAKRRDGAHTSRAAPLTSYSGSCVFSLKVRRGGSCLKPSVTAHRAACYESLKDEGGGREDETVPHLSRRSEGNPGFSIISTRKEEKKIGNKIVKLGCYILEVYVSAAARWEAGGRGFLFKGNLFCISSAAAAAAAAVKKFHLIVCTQSKNFGTTCARHHRSSAWTERSISPFQLPHAIVHKLISQPS
jgi:hypothetical protein